MQAFRPCDSIYLKFRSVQTNPHGRKGGEWVPWWGVGAQGPGELCGEGGFQGGGHVLCIDLGGYKINSISICGIFSQEYLSICVLFCMYAIASMKSLLQTRSKLPYVDSKENSG